MGTYHWIIVVLAFFMVCVNVKTRKDLSSVLWPVIAAMWCLMHAFK